MRDTDLPLIREIPLFCSMADENFDELMQASHFRQFRGGVKLISEGEPANFLHVVGDGVVEMFADSYGKETHIDLVRPYHSFILAAVIRDAVNLMSARTSGTCKILMIPSQNIHEAFKHDAAFARTIAYELGGHYRGMVKALKNQKLRTSVERLANYLLQEETKQGGSGLLELGLKKRVLASFLGMTPETLSRAFAALARCGVQVRGADVKLTKPKELKTLAKENSLIDDPES